MELSDRARRILHAVVTEFIETGEPVGSRTLSKRCGIDLSPASIRNVLADLEEEGFLYQPHTSAGRVPTDKAFRVYIDTLMTLKKLSGQEEAEIHALEGFGSMPDLLRAGGRVLSQLAGMASVVVAPKSDSRRLKQLRFIVADTDRKRLLAVLLFTDLSVENRFIDVDALPSDADLDRVHNLLSQVISERTLHEVRDFFRERMSHEQAELDALTHQAYGLGILATEHVDTRELVIQGQSRLLEQPDFGSADRLRQLVQALGERERLLHLLDRTIEASVVQVLVGNETGNLANGALSLVLAPVTEGGTSPVAAMGILGPMRMNYSRVVPLVVTTATVVSAAANRGAKQKPLRSVQPRRDVKRGGTSR